MSGGRLFEHSAKTLHSYEHGFIDGTGKALATRPVNAEQWHPSTTRLLLGTGENGHLPGAGTGNGPGQAIHLHICKALFCYDKPSGLTWLDGLSGSSAPTA